MVERPDCEKRLGFRSPYGSEKCHLRQRQTGNVNHSLPGEERKPLVGLICPSHAGLAYVVPCRPYEVAYQLLVPENAVPVIRQIGGHSLCAYHQPVGIFFGILVIARGCVI